MLIGEGGRASGLRGLGPPYTSRGGGGGVCGPEPWELPRPPEPPKPPDPEPSSPQSPRRSPAEGPPIRLPRFSVPSGSLRPKVSRPPDGPPQLPSESEPGQD